jgi:HD-like signal output (HDOD) protein
MTTVALDLKDVLRNAQLPALPQSAIRLLELSQNPDNGPSEFAVPIEADPGLTGQVLKFVNSSYFGFSREISSVKLAITLVGIRTIKNFALWSAVFSLVPNPRCGPFDLKTLWQDSLRRALFARNFGRLLGMKDAEECFAAALLQDMAIPLLAKEIPQRYLRLFQDRSDGKERLSSLEQANFGWTHANAAAFMCRSWALPEEFATLIESHCNVEELVTSEDMDAGKVAVALSSLLPAASDKEWKDRDRFLGTFNQLAAGKRTTAPRFLAEIDKAFAEFAPVLRISAPAKSLASYLEEAAAAV